MDREETRRNAEIRREIRTMIECHERNRRRVGEEEKRDDRKL